MCFHINIGLAEVLKFISYIYFINFKLLKLTPAEYCMPAKLSTAIFNTIVI